MISDSFRVLLRVAAELYLRSFRVKEHLQGIQLLGATQYGQFAETIEAALNGIEEGPLETLHTHGTLPESDVARALYPQLNRFSHWFAQNHEILVYLPVHDVLPETVDCLRTAFGSAYHRINPSMILGTLFNAFEFDFYALLGRVLPDFKAIRPAHEKNIALQLPVCDRQCPGAWAILAHEMGHSVDKLHQISVKVARHFAPDTSSRLSVYAKNWARELCADLVAAEAFGPTAMLSILSIEYCVFPLREVHQPSESHPTTIWRLRAVAEYLRSRYGHDYLATELAFYESAWDYSVERNVPASAQATFREQDILKYQYVVQPLAEALCEEIPKYITSDHVLDAQSLSRCAQRLRKNVPISAQGDPRHLLREELQNYRNAHYASNDDRLRAFAAIEGRFREKPLQVPALLLSCWQRREELLSEAIDSWPAARDPRAHIQALCEKLAQLDWVGVQSLGASMIQRDLERSSGME